VELGKSINETVIGTSAAQSELTDEPNGDPSRSDGADEANLAN